MDITIRQETPEDYAAVFELIKYAFSNEEFSDHREHLLVERLRKTDAFIPELSLVAVLDHEVVGHILLTRICVVNNNDVYDSLALAPVSVLPKYQRNGIGGILIEAAHQKARSLGHTSIILLGHADYYPRFGYRRADAFGIQLSFDVPPENCMAIELTEKGLANVSGMVKYPDVFFE